MLFEQALLEGVRAGRVTLAFRRWRRPSVKAGGTLLTAAGQLEISDVRRTTLDEISESDARDAGYPTRRALLDALQSRHEGEFYRIELGRLRPDPRIALRSTVASAGDADAVRARLARLDARSAKGPWTMRTLRLIAEHPGVRAGDLCRMVGLDKAPFKINVRKLKGLGLTECLEVGYRLSPRGTALLETEQN